MPSESLVITKDENIVDVNCVIHYEIKDLKLYLTNLSNPITFIRNISEASIRTLLGKVKLETILVKNKYDLQKNLKENIQLQLDSHLAGIEVKKVNLQDIHPPIEVVESFREVTSAREDKNTLIYEALEYKEREIPAAKALGHQMILNSHAFSKKSLLTAQGDLGHYRPLGILYKKYKQQLKLKKYYDYISKAYSASTLYIISNDLFNNFEFHVNKEQEEVDSGYDIN